MRVVCPLSVGGSFEGRTSAMSGVLNLVSPRPFDLVGEISVDLNTLDTGLALRNEHMRENYLEVSRAPGYETAVLSNVQLPDADASTISGKTRFTARLSVHGVAKALRGTAEIKRTARGVHIEARFSLHLPDFEIAKPRYLGVGVTDDIQITAAFDAEPAEGAVGK